MNTVQIIMLVGVLINTVGGGYMIYLRDARGFLWLMVAIVWLSGFFIIGV